MLQNPYTSGKVVESSERFIGRKNIIQKIIKGLSSYPVTILYGQRRVGKSSILYRIENELAKDKHGYIPVFCSLEGQLDQPIHLLIAQIVNSVCGVCNLTKVDNNPGENLVREFENSWLTNAINEVRNNGRRGIVLLLDEFDDVGDPVHTENADNFYFSLKNALSSHQQLKVVAIVGRDPRTLIKSAQELLEKSIDFHVPLMSFAEITELIRLSITYLTWTEEAVNEIWWLTHGHPLLAQSLCSRIWNKYASHLSEYEKPIVNKEEITNALAMSAQEFGHVVDYAWMLLNSQEQFIVCYLATLVDKVKERDILSYLEMKELTEYFRKPSLVEILSEMQKSDWIEKADDGYFIQIPIFEQRIRQTHDLSSLIDILFNDQERAFLLYARASETKNDLDAINFLERSLRVYPDNADALYNLREKYCSVIEFCLNNDDNTMALSYTKHLSQYDSSLQQYFEQRIQSNIKANLIIQKIDLAIREDKFNEGYSLINELKKYKPESEIEYDLNVIWAQLKFVVKTYMASLVLLSPIIITLLIVREYANFSGIFSNLFTIVFLSAVFLISFLAAYLKSLFIPFFRAIGFSSENHYLLVLANVVGLLFIYFGLPDVPFDFRLAVGLSILLSSIVIGFTRLDNSFKIFFVLLVDVLLGIISFFAWAIDKI